MVHECVASPSTSGEKHCAGPWRIYLMSFFFAMTQEEQSPSEGQLYVALYFCRQCRFNSIDLERITQHVNNHMLGASLRYQNPYPMTSQYFCRQCQFTSVDLECITQHVNNHISEASLRYQNSHPMVSTQQLRERNLYFNPFHQILQSSTHHSAFISGNDNFQMQQSAQDVEAMRRSSQANMMQAEQRYVERGTEGNADDLLMPLLDQLNQPSAAIIDLESDQNNASNIVDLTLQL